MPPYTPAHGPGCIARMTVFMTAAFEMTKGSLDDWGGAYAAVLYRHVH